MSASDDDDLDGILDSALDNFQVDDVVNTPPPSAPPANAKANTTSTTTSGTEAQASNENIDTNGGFSSEEAALRAFREALAAPLPSAGDAAEEEMDMRLLEQFMKSVESMHTNNTTPTTPGDTNTNDSGGGENFIKALIDDLLSKEVLIEPITQVKEGIAAYLERHPGMDTTTAGCDGARYKRQYELASQLVEELDGGGRPQRIIELLAALKDCGSFPDGIIDGLPDPNSISNNSNSSGALADDEDADEIGADIAAMTEACKLQ